MLTPDPPPPDLQQNQLQRRGAYKEAYAPGTLREKLFGGGRLLPDSHPAAAQRNWQCSTGS